MYLFSTSIAFLLAWRSVWAIEVAGGSRCAPLCLNSPGADVNDIYASGTKPSDLICNDWELTGANSTTRGRKWVDCLSCTSTSTTVDEEANDVYWFLCMFSPRIVTVRMDFILTQPTQSISSTMLIFAYLPT